MHLSGNIRLQGGKYEIIEKIGQGGFGIAYKANHLLLNKIVCIKEFFYSDLCERKQNSSELTIISASSEKIQLVDSFKKKFIKEAQRLAAFQHPNIVQVTDVFEENNTAYFVMEYLEGGSLQDKLDKTTLTEDQTLKIILPVLDALSAVHKAKLLHLDIKPTNIMFRKDGTPVLIDFGISKYMANSGGQTSTAPIGLSKGYAPIEQYGGDVSDFSEATDIYSVCATMYRMTTGLVPPEPLQIMANGLTSPTDIQQELSMKFSDAIVKGLSVKSVERPNSVSNLCNLLNEKLGEETIATRKDDVFYNKSNDKLSSVLDVVQTTVIQNEDSNTVNTINKRKSKVWVTSVLSVLIIGLLIFMTRNYVSYNYPKCYETDDKTVTPYYRERAREGGTENQYVKEVGTVTDIDGNIYKTVKIGNQVWMAENLKVTHYRNGDRINHIANDEDWVDAKNGAYCMLNNNNQNRNKYGLLYNGYAVDDSRKIAPEGWHVATQREWVELIEFLGRFPEDKLKEKGFAHWTDFWSTFTFEPEFWEKLLKKKKVKKRIVPIVPSQYFATNSSGFTALPGGMRDSEGEFEDKCGAWWLNYGFMHYPGYESGVKLYNDNVSHSVLEFLYNKGLSVRCVKDN